MENIKELTKLTLIELKKKNLPSTPEKYFIEFKNQATQLNEKYKEILLFDELKSNIASEKEIYSYMDLLEILSNRPPIEDLEKLIENLDEVLAASIDISNQKRINEFIDKVSKEPKLLLEKSSINQLREITRQRIKADKNILRNKTRDIIKFISLMGKYFDRTILESSNSIEEIHKIKDELEKLNISNASHRELGLVQKKLIDTVHNIENNMEKSQEELSLSKEKFEELNKTIEELQKKLDEAREEKSTDFLTGVLNRRAFEEEIEKIEKKYEIFNSNYAVVFFDIDHFKSINDNHGHECGDVVLKTFGSLLKALTREEDVISRYGGEEFVALVNYEDKEELTQYALRVKNLVGNSKFVYKDINIEVKFSAGISFRNKYTNYLNTKKKADELLYKAKKTGRDKILFDDGKEI